MKIGDTVTWVSQSQGVEKEKCGTVIDIIPAGKSGYSLLPREVKKSHIKFNNVSSVAVNRPYGKSDYIPCIVWGRNARFVSGLEVGTHIQLWGRLQSREYQKKNGEEEIETRVAYEVSVSRIEVVEETEE